MLPLRRLPELLDKWLDELRQTLHDSTKHMRRYFALCKHRHFPQLKTSLHDINLLNGSLFRKLNTKTTYTPLYYLITDNPAQIGHKIFQKTSEV